MLAGLMMAMPRTTDMRDPQDKVMREYFEGLVEQFTKAGKRCHTIHRFL
ncbi:MAG: hypothetical protein LBF12_07085 [Christensenellaceae bacterium]|jgi:hypothetical protein|nr:hypothetical protein [Christensenellaceae bacterium]